jgi:hypothetical protein
MSDTEAFEDEIAEAFVESEGIEESTAADAVSKAAAFREDHDEELTAEDVLAALEAAPYDSFQHSFDWVIGDFASAVENCTDSRPYRLSGFGDLAADPEQGA